MTADNLTNQIEVLLSIIVPLHNSRYKCQRLLTNLMGLQNLPIELFLIDDGSTDGTYEHICEFAAKVGYPAYVVGQENRGPGGARNRGLRLSNGKYIWFVDSDDSITKEAIDYFITLVDQNYDFIDFNILSGTNSINSMELPCGAYEVDEKVRNRLLAKFGRICTKIVKREFLIDNRILYPENCIYEDNPLTFIYPFLTNRFFKADIVGYVHYEDFESVTRQKSISRRFYDRLATATYGFRRSERFIKGVEDRKTIEEKFIKLFLINTVSSLVTRFPSKYWLMAIRVMKYYREKAHCLDVKFNPFSFIEGSKWYRFLFLSLWMLTYFLPSQKKYFNELHLVAWGKQIKYIP